MKSIKCNILEALERSLIKIKKSRRHKKNLMVLQILKFWVKRETNSSIVVGTYD